MIQRELRLVCRGIQLISVFEEEESSRNQKTQTTGLNLEEETRNLPSLGQRVETRNLPAVEKRLD